MDGCDLVVRSDHVDRGPVRVTVDEILSSNVAEKFGHVVYGIFRAAGLYGETLREKEGSMPDRLLIGVLGNRNSGKSHTWNALFGRVVRRGRQPHRLELRAGECVDAFLISGSFEERREYAGDILENEDCRIVLCSMQYAEAVRQTLDYLNQNDFFLFIQWLNPGYTDSREVGWDRLGLISRILSQPSVVSIRSGQVDATPRVQELREFIYGWARFRDLIFNC
jgi:hypothetical protein